MHCINFRSQKDKTPPPLLKKLLIFGIRSATPKRLLDLEQASQACRKSLFPSAASLSSVCKLAPVDPQMVTQMPVLRRSSSPPSLPFFDYSTSKYLLDMLRATHSTYYSPPQSAYKRREKKKKKILRVRHSFINYRNAISKCAGMFTWQGNNLQLKQRVCVA